MLHRAYEKATKRFRQFLVGPTQRASSFPFVSGDTFRAIADIVLEGRLASIHHESQKRNELSVVFAEPEHVSLACKLGVRIGDDCVLIVHNGDIIDSSQIMAATAWYKHVFCVNWLAFHPRITAIPIGLENVHHGTNGVLSGFEDALPFNRHRLPQDSHRAVPVLAAFNPDTNVPARTEALREFASQDWVHTPTRRLSPSQYRQLVRRSKFVLSPPGNGPDCHRTWESIYLGAIPVVLASAWPFHALDLPVLVVESWTQAHQLLATNASQIYAELHEIPIEKSLFPFFQNLISQARTGPRAND